jgi:hypothetical protein
MQPHGTQHKDKQHIDTQYNHSKEKHSASIAVMLGVQFLIVPLSVALLNVFIQSVLAPWLLLLLFLQTNSNANYVVVFGGGGRGIDF